jgi:hypothetical protein
VRKLLLLFAMLLLPALASATSLEVDDVRIDGPDLLVSVRVPRLFGPKTEKRLQSGKEFQTKLTFYLVADRDWAPDSLLAQRTLTVSATYDAVREEFTVVWKFKGQELLRETLRSTADVRNRLETYRDLPVFRIDPAWRGESLTVEARAFLGTDYVLGLATEDWTERDASRPFRLP